MGGRRNRHGLGRGNPSKPMESGFDRAMNSGSGEMNPHLSEKLKMSSSSYNKPANMAPVARNREIRAYMNHIDQLESKAAEDDGFPCEIPTADELLNSSITENFRVFNVIDRPWTNSKAYLHAHHQLLREDTLRPLRQAVLIFRENPLMKDGHDFSVYEKVHIAGVTFAHQGVAIRVRFSTARAGKNILWEHSKRLIPGSMVALSPTTDNFKNTCIVATVAARPLTGVQMTPPEVDIFFARPEDTEIDPQIEFIMLESRSGYFEATRHVLKAISKLESERFPLSSQIVSLDPNIDSPEYLKMEPHLSLLPINDKMSKVDVLNNWPVVPSGDLDASQWAALHRILTKELCIVQGPPGTGKTFVSVTALRILLANKTEDDPPIIVAAHTNHALDQLLRHVATFERKYIRLGGQSTDEEVKTKTLFEVRKRTKNLHVQGGCLGGAIQEYKILSAKMIKTLAPLTFEIDQDNNISLLKMKVFQDLGLLSKKQVESLEKGAARWTGGQIADTRGPLALWLDKHLNRFEVVYQDGNFGFADAAESETDQEYEQLRELEAEQGGDEGEKHTLAGIYQPLVDDWTISRGTYRSSAMVQKYLDSYDDLWSIPQAMRGPVYSLLKKSAKELIRATFRAQASQYARVTREIQIGKWERDSVVLENSNLIGMTMTGLSKYRPLVAGIKPKIILIEEAAEVLEAPLAVACLESLEHFILVGDHQQLQPSTSVPSLARAPYHLNVSLFERLVRNGVPFDTLIRQRRMDPEFRRLLMPIYDTLEDHHSVIGRPIPPGCKYKSWFFSHEWPESTDSSFSKMNEQEALMIAAFFDYLVLNGVPINGITVLTFYNAQRKKILREMRKNSRLASSYLNVATVDSYQGEENAIILLSLVRSATDQNKSIGFCGIPNRVCVALSRARLGFYIFGKGKQMYDASSLWRQVITIMIKGQDFEPKRVGYDLPLVCVKHGREFRVREPEDFKRLNGGCDLDCHELLDCGHQCSQKCHPYNHNEVDCTVDCHRKLPCGHTCQRKCSQVCYCLCKGFSQLLTKDTQIQNQSTSPPVLAYPVYVATPSIPPKVTHPTTRTDVTVPGTRTVTEQGSYASRRKLLEMGPQHIVSPGNSTRSVTKPLQNRSPEKWRIFAEGGVVEDDRLRRNALQRQKPVEAVRKELQLLDLDDGEMANPMPKQGNILKATKLSSLSAYQTDGIISERVTHFKDSHGVSRKVYRHEYISPAATATAATLQSQTLASGTDVTKPVVDPDEPLIEL